MNAKQDAATTTEEVESVLVDLDGENELEERRQEVADLEVENASLEHEAREEAAETEKAYLALGRAQNALRYLWNLAHERGTGLADLPENVRTEVGAAITLAAAAEAAELAKAARKKS